MSLTLAILMLSLYSPLFSSPLDQDGWGLRLQRISGANPYIEGENIGRTDLLITLINFSKEQREHFPIVVLFDRELTVGISQANGKPHPRVVVSLPPPPRDPCLQPVKIQPGGISSFPFNLSGESNFYRKGRYRVEAELKMNGKKLVAPPIELEVIDIPSEAILFSHEVPLAGKHAERPADQQCRPYIQQLKFGTRTLLVYRIFVGSKYGGGIQSTYRLPELPGKVEMKVSGAYESGTPLRITYLDPSDLSSMRTLVIDAIDGTPWTQEKQEDFEYTHSIAPAPRPKP